MAYCDRVHALEFGDGYSALFLDTQHMGGLSGAQPVPKARSFELPGDAMHYAPDRPADVRHVKLVMRSILSEDRRYRRPVVYYVYYDQGFELFDYHIYFKGAWVLHMLRHQLGEAAFRCAIKVYLQRYREREVITADLERTFSITALGSSHLFLMRFHLLRAIVAQGVQRLLLSVASLYGQDDVTGLELLLVVARALFWHAHAEEAASDATDSCASEGRRQQTTGQNWTDAGNEHRGDRAERAADHAARDNARAALFQKARFVGRGWPVLLRLDGRLGRSGCRNVGG